MTIYQDPALPGRVRPGLVSELLGQPAWEQHHQLENQASIVLAWLIDRSPAIGRRILDLWLEDHEIPADAVIGARDQVVLPSKLRPDISIDVSGRLLQLLIEVKVGAEFAEHDGRLQDEAYRVEWKEMDEGEAEVRAVGTLTRDALDRPDTVDLPALRARDVEWSELKTALQDVIESGALDASIADITASLCEAIDLHIDIASIDVEGLPAFLARAQPLVEQLSASAGQLLGAAPSIAHGAHYAGAKLSYLGIDGGPVVVRIVAGAKGGAMTPLGAGETLLIGVGRDHSILLKGDDREKALGAGLGLVKTLHYTFTALRFAFDEAERNPSAVTAQLVSTLTAADLLPPGPDPARSQVTAAKLGYEYKGKINPSGL
jgi:hypothetical protein